MLHKVRNFVNAGILKAIYHALFESHIHYACLIWRQCMQNQSSFHTSKKKHQD